MRCFSLSESVYSDLVETRMQQGHNHVDKLDFPRPIPLLERRLIYNIRISSEPLA